MFKNVLTSLSTVQVKRFISRFWCFFEFMKQGIRTLHNSKWRGHVLKVEIAKPDWITRYTPSLTESNWNCGTEKFHTFVFWRRREELQLREEKILNLTLSKKREPSVEEVEKPNEEWLVVRNGLLLPILRLRDEKQNVSITLLILDKCSLMQSQKEAPFFQFSLIILILDPEWMRKDSCI